MSALSQVFEATRLVVPCTRSGERTSENPLAGRNVVVVPLTVLSVWLLLLLLLLRTSKPRDTSLPPVTDNNLAP